MKKRITLIGLACCMMLALTGLAAAQQMTFSIQSQHPYKVDLEFYSQDRNAAWPGDGRVYPLDDYDTHAYTLNCIKGEQICYGAWDRGVSSTYWGVGQDNAEYCSDCCYTCGQGDTELIILQAGK